MSVQLLQWSRTAAYTEIPKNEIDKSPLTDILKTIVDIYNKNKPIKKPYEDTEYAKGPVLGFSVKLFAKPRQGKTAAVQVVEEEGAEKLVANSGQDLLFFFYRTQPVREIFAATTGSAWKVVRHCIDYTFPLKAVMRTLNPQTVTTLVLRCLVGADTKKVLTNPNGHELYTTDMLYHQVESFICKAKLGSSLMRLDLYQSRPPMINVETGLLRVLRKIPLLGYFDLLDHFSQHARGEASYRDDGSKELPDPFFDFLQFLQPAKVGKDKLDLELVKCVFAAFQKEEPQSIHLRHKYLDDFLYADNYKLKIKRTSHEFSQRPSLEELLNLIFEADPFDTADKLLSALKGTCLNYQKDNGHFDDPLIQYLEGEVRFQNGSSYFKVRGMWYKISADYHSLLQPDFRAMLQKSMLDPETSKELLPHSWAGNDYQGKVFRDDVKNLLGIEKGIQDFWKKLTTTKIRYIEKSTVKQKKLIGEILNNKIVSKHQAIIEEKILQSSQFPSAANLKTLLGNDYTTVMQELELERDVIQDKYVVNPFPYFLRTHTACKEENKYKKLEEFLIKKHQASLSKEDENAYNCGYLFKDINQNKPFGPETGYLVFDRICPLKIEPADIIKYEENKTYLFHVKEDLGQHTRDACSQIVNAAKQFSAALRLHQSSSYLDELWREATASSDATGFKAEVKQQLEHLGKETFFDLFRRKKIVFVYALLKKQGQSLNAEAKLLTFISEKNFSTFKENGAKIFKALIDQQFLDARGRLTGKFYSKTKSKSNHQFILEGFEKDSEAIYGCLKPAMTLSDSTLAKVDLLRTAQEIERLGFEFKICEIEKKITDPTSSQSQQSLATQSTMPDSLTQLPDEPIDDDLTPASSTIDQIAQGPIGFTNIGNSCYLNATLQMLFNAPEIRTKITEKKDTSPLLISLNKLMEASSKTEATPILKLLRQEVFKKAGKGELVQGINAQHDAQEFMQLILDQLAWHPMQTFTRFFYDKKQDISDKVNSNHLQIPIKGTFQASLDAYLAQEEREENEQKEQLCRKIKNKQVYFPKWKQAIRIDTPPTYLIIHLQRFEFEHGQTKRISKEVAFPDNGEVILRNGPTSTNYEIIGYVNHLGQNAASGHYRAYIKNHQDPVGQERWIHCDDDSLKIEDPSKEIEKTAYLVLLKKK